MDRKEQTGKMKCERIELGMEHEHHGSRRWAGCERGKGEGKVDDGAWKLKDINISGRSGDGRSKGRMAAESSAPCVRLRLSGRGCTRT